MLSRSKFIFIISISVLLVFIVLVSLYLFLFRNNNQSQNYDDSYAPTLIEQSTDDINESVQLIDEYFQSQKSESIKVAENINTVEDLVNIPEAEQHLVGIEVIENNISKGNLKTAREFSVYLMRKDTKDGFDATFKCYETSTSETEKEECFNRAQIISRQLGFIGEDENLPDDYLVPIDSENQDG